MSILNKIVRTNCKRIVGTGYAKSGSILKVNIYIKNNIVLGTEFNIFDNNLQTNIDSLKTEWLKGKNINNCLNINNHDITNYFKFPQERTYVSVLIEKAIKNAVKDYNNISIK